MIVSRLSSLAGHRRFKNGVASHLCPGHLDQVITMLS
jgi:hypothetical protein